MYLVYTRLAVAQSSFGHAQNRRKEFDPVSDLENPVELATSLELRLS